MNKHKSISGVYIKYKKIDVYNFPRENHFKTNRLTKLPQNDKINKY